MGARFTNVYDAAGQTVVTVNPLNQRNSFIYDKAGQLRSLSDGLGFRTTWIYDAVGQRTAMINRLFNRTTYLYSKTRRHIATIDALLNRTSTIFDSAGQVLAEADGNNHRTSFVYDVAGRRTAFIDANTNRATFGYDASGRLVTQKDALSRVTTFGYDAASRLQKRIDARGVITTYFYDAASQDLGRAYSDGTRVTFAYDALGNRTSMRDSSGRYTYSYDSLARLSVARDWTGSRLTYTYDALGQPRSMGSPAGQFTYTYDAIGQSTVIQNPRTTWTYGPTGSTISKRNGNGTRVSYLYDREDQITRARNMIPSMAAFVDYRNTYDKVGNRVRTDELVSGRSTTYLYDKAYQLVADVTGANRNTYSYDPVGNRRVFQRQTGTRVTYSYDAANQMTRFVDAGVPVTFTYDQAGNTLTQRNTTQPFNTTMTWDAENRLRCYQQVGIAGGNNFNQRLTHTYNGDGLRVERAAIGGPTNARFVWDRQNIHLKLNTSNALVDYYVYELRDFGNLVATGASGRTHHYDPLSSTTALSTSGGTVGEAYSYTPWGEISAPDPLNSAVNPFLYIGRMGYYSDDEGINKTSTSPLLPFQVRARFYNPIWGRWISPDPLRYNQIDSNLYRYVRNSPPNIVDPSGDAPPNEESIFGPRFNPYGPYPYDFYDQPHGSWQDFTRWLEGRARDIGRREFEQWLRETNPSGFPGGPAFGGPGCIRFSPSFQYNPQSHEIDIYIRGQIFY